MQEPAWNRVELECLAIFQERPLASEDIAGLRRSSGQRERIPTLPEVEVLLQKAKRILKRKPDLIKSFIQHVGYKV